MAIVPCHWILLTADRFRRSTPLLLLLLFFFFFFFSPNNRAITTVNKHRNRHMHSLSWLLCWCISVIYPGRVTENLPRDCRALPNPTDTCIKNGKCLFYNNTAKRDTGGDKCLLRFDSGPCDGVLFYTGKFRGFGIHLPSLGTFVTTQTFRNLKFEFS